MFSENSRASTDSSFKDQHLESEPFIDRELAGPEHTTPQASGNQRWISLIIVAQWVVLGISCSLNTFLWFRSDDRTYGVFSPVQDAIEYHDVVYASGFNTQITKFQGPPSPEVDQAWFELYPSTMTRISAAEAAKLANKTVRIPDDLDNYIVSIDIFHQMHCLNVIRKKVWGIVPDTYIEEKMLEIEHVDHCVDSIRQSLMCAGDITPLPWKWRKNDTDGTDLLAPEAHVVHTCRNFDSIVRWAKDRKIVNLTRDKKPIDE